MKADRRVLLQIALLCSLPCVMFVSCAEGTNPFESTSATSGGDAGIPPGQIGAPCNDASDCTEGTCTQVGTEKFCTIPCPPGCPEGTYCALIQGDSICVPDEGQQCLQCSAPVDCKNPSDSCLTAPLGDKFCAMDCTTLGSCPNGFTCVDAEQYANGGGGSGGSGGGSGGSGNGGGAGATSASTGGSQPPGVPYKFCVPSGNLSCPCNSKRDGVTHQCKNENAFGKCTGTETCDGEAWQGCTAATPAAETCNNQDDNCDMQVDNGDPLTLCGPLPPNATWACNAGSCGLGPCDPGWDAFPPGPPSQGCSCQKELGEPNGNCVGAAGAGTVSDAGGSITVSGTISSAGDVDFWTFNTTDTNQVNTNTYHVSIDFTAPTPNDEFIFDVIRGANCVDNPSGPTTAITSYDWCVDGSSGTEGEISCGPQAPVHCGNHSLQYFLRVYRKPGATGTCTQYTITITATGGDPCDFTQKCQ